ncbi:40S ribosomal protein s4-like [Forsythia ovata]|uniref:40S ribosomal protein s4-like n=1 Tax=Forsythia ovata TaxID=205694 RepID=A0ABD1TN87_9LAMI
MREKWFEENLCFPCVKEQSYNFLFTEENLVVTAASASSLRVLAASRRESSPRRHSPTGDSTARNLAWTSRLFVTHAHNKSVENKKFLTDLVKVFGFLTDSFQKSMYCGIALDFCIAISDYPVKIFNRLPSFFDLKEGTAPLNLYVENEFHRSTRGGAGDVKSITNYSPARGLKKHLKRLNAPKHWMLDKLGGAFCPLNVMHAGSQTVIRTPQIKGVLALILILRNRLKYALTYREVIAILMQRHILVDGKVRTDKTYPAGFMAMGLSLANGELLSPSGLVFGRRTNLLP